jgi:hypothetical protein
MILTFLDIRENHVMNKTHNTQAGASKEVENAKFYDIEDTFSLLKKRDEPVVEKSRNILSTFN